MSKGRIFVFLATGDQGKSACKYLHEDGFQVVGLTRNPDGDGAKKLKEMGVELVKGDMADPSTYSSALEGCSGAFINADFWGPYFSSGLDADHAAKTEGKQSRDAVEACVKAGVGHIVYSSLEEMPKERPCPHFDSKAAVSKYIREQNIPATHLYTSTYFNNCTKFGYLKPNSAGDGWTMDVGAPDKVVLPSFASEQTGLFVRAVFRDTEKYKGKNIYAAGENLTVEEYAKAIAEVSGKKVEAAHMTDEQFFDESLKEKITPELFFQLRMFYYNDMPRDVQKSKEIVPEVWDCREWARNSKDLQNLLGFTV